MKKTLIALLTLFTAFAADSAWAQNIRRHPGSIPNQYIVVLATADDSEAVGLETQSLYAGRLEHVYRKALNGFAIRLTPAAAAALARDPRVKYVEEDGVVQATSLQSNPPWGLDRIDQRSLPLDGSYSYPDFKTQVFVHVIDTGVRTTHVEFGGRAFNAGDFVDDDNNPNTPAGNDDGDPSTLDGADCNGHGTHVAGTIAGATYGVAKNAIILSHRALNCAGQGTGASVIAAIDAVTGDARRPAVANMSLGGGVSTALDDAVRNGIAAGITFVVSAGNSNADASTQSPARVAEAITVGATDAGDTRASFSNFGPLVDLFAPGVGIVSAWNASDSASATLSGTSMASPHVAGVAALYMEQVGIKTPAQVQAAIVAAATSGVVGSRGAGSPNLLLYSLVGFTISPLPTPIVTFVGTDIVTQGNWKGMYGTQGYLLVNDGTSLPAGATVTASGHSSYTWGASSADVRALQKSAAADRIAATWYSGGTFTIDVNAGDTQAHRVGLYVLDWENSPRGQTVEVLDPSTGAVLDTRTITGFSGGQYWTWQVSGTFRFRVTRTAGVNAVVSAVFLDPAIGANQPPTVSITNPAEGASFGAPAAIAISATASDPDVGGSVAYVDFYGDGVWISRDSTAPFTATWNIATVGAHAVSAIATDDKAAPSVPAVVHVTVTGGSGPTVTFVGTDTTTRGTWKGVYGTQGYLLVNDGTSLPAGATVTASGHNSWTWAASSGDVRALQKVAGVDRLAATWYSGGNFTIDVNAGDTQAHRVGLYVLDWENSPRSQTVEVLDPSTGAVLDTRSITAFSGGQYWTWQVSGTFRFRVTRTGGVNAVVSAVFLDPQ